MFHDSESSRSGPALPSVSQKKKKKSVHKILMSVPARLTEMTRYKSENVWSRWKSMCQELYFTRLWHVLNVQIWDKEAWEIGREMNEYIWERVYIKVHGIHIHVYVMS